MIYGPFLHDDLPKSSETSCFASCFLTRKKEPALYIQVIPRRGKTKTRLISGTAHLAISIAYRNQLRRIESTQNARANKARASCSSAETSWPLVTFYVHHEHNHKLWQTVSANTATKRVYIRSTFPSQELMFRPPESLPFLNEQESGKLYF